MKSASECACMYGLCVRVDGFGNDFGGKPLSGALVMAQLLLA